MGKPATPGYKRTLALVIAAVVGLTGALLAPASAKTTKLTFWSWRVEDKVFYESVIADFRKTNPNIEITFQAYPNADYATILSSAMAAGKGPDIVHVRAYGALDQLIVPGYLSVLKGREVKGLKSFDKSIVNSMRGFTDKRLFGVPFATQSLGIFSNKDLLRRAGITRDTSTYGEFLANLEKLRRLESSLLLMVDQHTWSRCGELSHLHSMAALNTMMQSLKAPRSLLMLHLFDH